MTYLGLKGHDSTTYSDSGKLIIYVHTHTCVSVYTYTNRQKGGGDK